jgi:hypothetical protein
MGSDACFSRSRGAGCEPELWRGTRIAIFRMCYVYSKSSDCTRNVYQKRGEMTMTIERRIRALEAKMKMEAVVLHCSDNSTQELRGRGDFLLRLLRGVCGRADLNAGQAEQLEFIRKCVGSKAAGGGHLIELLHCLLHAQADAALLPVGSQPGGVDIHGRGPS